MSPSAVAGKGPITGTPNLSPSLPLQQLLLFLLPLLLPQPLLLLLQGDWGFGEA